MIARVRLTLNSLAYHQNVTVLKRCSPGARLVAVVKANAYGHGSRHAVEPLQSKVDAFAVASVEEGVCLRHHGVVLPIWVLSDFDAASDLAAVIEHKLEPVVHNRQQLDAICALHDAKINVRVKLDTGMGRLGFSNDEFASAVSRLQNCPAVDQIGVMSHLANADDREDGFTSVQVDRFRSATDELEYHRSLANSAGILAWPDSHFDWVRPGIALYGASPFKHLSAQELGLQPVMTLSTRVLSTRRFEQGQTVGYGGTWTCSRATHAAVLACGYGDGYPRYAPNGTPVLAGGRRVPLIGRVSMDTMLVDISDVDNVRVGDEVVLWGEGLPADVVATACGTIVYELFCRLTGRVSVRER